MKDSINYQENSPFARPVADPYALCRDWKDKAGPGSNLGNLATVTSEVWVMLLCSQSLVLHRGPAVRQAAVSLEGDTVTIILQSCGFADPQA